MARSRATALPGRMFRYRTAVKIERCCSWTDLSLPQKGWAAGSTTRTQPCPPCAIHQKEVAAPRAIVSSFMTKKNVPRIRERMIQEAVLPRPPPRPATGRSRRAVAHPSFEFRPQEFRYIPTGKLFLAVLSVVSYYEYQKTEDTPPSQIEAKLVNLVNRLEEVSLRRKQEQESRHERELDRRTKSIVWEQTTAKKDALLNQLAAFEKMAHDLDRAESLCRLSENIRANPSAPAELVASLDHLAKLARPIRKTGLARSG